MENLCNVLEILFKKISVKEILKGDVRYNNIKKDFFADLAKVHYRKYSGNDAGNLYEYLRAELSTGDAGKPGNWQEYPVNVFEALDKFNSLVLKEIEEIPVCRYRYLLKWRMVSFALEEELFTTSFLAGRDYARHRAWRKNFAWKYIISSDNVELNNMLNRGLAENHFHLKGSAPYFYMSWINLMNQVNDKKFIRILRKYDENRMQEFSVYHTEAAEASLVLMHLQSALIRLYLYTWITEEPFSVLEHNFIRFDRINEMIDWDIFDDTVDINENNGQNRRSFWELIQGRDTVYEKCRADEVVWQFAYSRYRTDSIKRGLFIWICNNILKNIDINELSIPHRRMTERELVYRCFSVKPMVDVTREFIIKFIRQDRKKELGDQMALREVELMLQNPKYLFLNRDRIQDMITNLKMRGGKPLDYMQCGLDMAEEELYAERWLLYTMFRKLYEGEYEARKRGNFFYAYLVIKERIRAELIQVNERVGFDNFLQYQNRKEEFIDGTVLSNVYSRHAVVSSFNEQPLSVLEARITPRETAKGNWEYIKKMDKEILRNAKKSDYKFVDGKPLTEHDFFYVFHFVKEPEREMDLNTAYKCRHYRLRNKVKRQAVAIYNFRERYAKEASRVYGIDACSPEIGCRPEVFAQAFRYLKGEQNFTDGRFPEKRRPRLRTTYHVGEDFLDIVDGMRAIDEAIFFLNMTHGDRLGHALALGISPREWYQFKEYRVLCPKQDMLDNTVWIYQKVRKYNIRGDAFLLKMQRRFAHLFQDIYLRNNRSEESCDIDFYYDAWKLRGDNPEHYYTVHGNGDGHTRQHSFSALDLYAENIKYPELEKIRRQPKCTGLYHRYHYDEEVKRNGQVIVEYKIEQEMIQVVEQIQYYMQRELLDRGIAIETNPSSNYLIGTFRAYEKHPILNWYNKGLTNDREELEKCPQLDVLINTDDQAVFGTSLENEFALMAVALEKARDSEGNLKYKKDMIYDWLDDIRKKGFTRCFRQLRGNTGIEKEDVREETTRRGE